MEAEFVIDSKELEGHIKAVARMFPVETQKATARFLGDMAWEFKQTAPEVISKKYTVRNMGFLKGKKAFTVQRPKASDKIADQKAEASSMRIDDGATGLFTGFAEEIEGKPAEMRAKGGGYHRPMMAGARGGNPSARVKDVFKLGPGNDIPDSRSYGLPLNQYVSMLAKNPEKLGKGRTFIMGGAEFPLGLYRFKPGKSQYGPNAPEIESLQQFSQKPPNTKRFDWQEETVAEVQKKFTPQYILEKYLYPVLEKLWKKSG